MGSKRSTTEAVTGWAIGAICAIAAASGAAAAAVEPPPAEQQLASAVLAAPEDRRAAATVLGWDASGRTVMLREGTNDMVCLADRPGDEGWSVACYHESLEPFMRRGRELEAAGVQGEERTKRRYDEIAAGTLAMPRSPATLYVLHGKGWDAAAGKVIEPYLRYVVYTPYATQATTGLPTEPPGPGGPWIMFPGTPAAHIMITPPRPEPPATEAAPEKESAEKPKESPPAG